MKSMDITKIISVMDLNRTLERIKAECVGYAEGMCNAIMLIISYDAGFISI